MKSNRYSRKRRHKQKLEQQYANKFGYYHVKSCRDKLIREAEEGADSWWRRKHPPRNKGWEYWRVFYLSGKRKFAKRYTDKHIRQKYRQMMCHYDPEDVTAPKGADYEKEFDYAWTVW